MNIAHGTELQGLKKLTVELPDTGTAKWQVDIRFDKSNPLENQIKNHSPDSVVHGKTLKISSGRKLNNDRSWFDSDQCWSIAIEGVTTFSWKNDSDIIYISASPNKVSQEFVFWLLHSIIPFNLIVREKTVFLHASAIEVDGRALLFLAPSLGGKSTLAGKFIDKGHKMISDDKVAMYYSNNHCHAVPSYPYYRPYRKYEDLGYHVDEFCPDHLPVQALYILKRDKNVTDVVINKVTGLEKFSYLQESTLYSPHTLSPKVMSRLLKLSGYIDMYEAVIPDNIHLIEDVYKTIRDHSSDLPDGRNAV